MPRSLAWLRSRRSRLPPRHLYIQSQPPGSVASCGAPLGVMLKFSPLTEVVRKVLTGGGECSQVNWKFAGLAMPAWVLFAAVVLGGAGVFANSRNNRRWSAPTYMRCSASISSTLHALVDLVNGGVYDTELDDFGAAAAQ